MKVSKNKYATILFQLLNYGTVELPDNTIIPIWTKQQQRTALYSIALFEDAKRDRKRILSPRQQKGKLNNIADVVEVMNSGGQTAFIFELFELITKQVPLTDLSFRIIDRVIPCVFGLDTYQSFQDAEVEETYLQIARMKLTDKLSKVNFDTLKFFEMIDPKGKNTIELDLLFTEISDVFKVFFSV